MKFDSMYEVTKTDYTSFVEQIKPEFREVKTVKIDYTHNAVKIFSTNTQKCLCARVYCSSNSKKHTPEKYYIFEMPESYERQKPIPKMQLALESREEIQAFFDFISKQTKEKQLDAEKSEGE